MRGRALFAAAAAGVLLASGQAHADLIGTNVDTLFLSPDAATSLDLNGGATITVGPGVEYPSTNFLAAQSAGVTIDITGTQIIITNILGSTPFCSTVAVGAACHDSFDGFKFIFSNFASGVQITGVTVDKASAADFQPSDPPTSDPTVVQVNVVGDEPLINDPLILDIALSSNNNGGGGNNGGGASVPEPASLLMLASGLLMLSGFAAWRRQVTRR